MSITIRQPNNDEARWRDDNSFFIASKRINGKNKGNYNTPLWIKDFKDCCLFQYHIKSESVTKIVVYYDEEKLIKKLKHNFYLEGYRNKINQDELFIDEIVFDFTNLVDMNINYLNHSKISEVYEIHYMQLLGDWVYRTRSVDREIESLLDHDFFPEYEKKNKLLAKAYLRKEALGDKPKNNKKLPITILSFKPIEEFEDIIDAVNVDFRKETK